MKYANKQELGGIELQELYLNTYQQILFLNPKKLEDLQKARQKSFSSFHLKQRKIECHHSKIFRKI